MKFTVQIEMENAAFEADEPAGGGRCPELARILAGVASRVAEGWGSYGWGSTPVRLRDINGNVVGTAEFLS